jgi:hypothetical protein
MTVTAKCLFETGYAANAQTTIYTAPPGARTIVDKITASNKSGAGVTFAANLVPSGGTAGASNKVFDATVADGTVESFAGIVGHVLNPGDFISIIAGTASALVLRISGREVTA